MIVDPSGGMPSNINVIMPRLHYGNVILAGLPEYEQSMINAAARLIYRTSRYMPTYHTPILRQLRWLWTRERLGAFKLAVVIFRCLHGLAPGYLSDDIRRVADTNRRRLRSSSSALLTVGRARLFAVLVSTICAKCSDH